ncbi:pilus assembly protein [Pseudactinotalea suaedae]|uniref:pilus assembly protein n=1 Tax=Pseudactinotalea suaedae TaxID=1524924 RepID=UPI001F500C1B|nr:pilus assembly protein [Pseudactinotalea suaedae]
MSPPTSTRWRRALTWARDRLGEPERGSAVVEFLGVSLVLLVPLVYLILTLARIQAASFAAEGAAREAGRLIAQAETMAEGIDAAQLGVELAFADQGLDVDPAAVLQVTCSVPECLTAGEYVLIEVRTEVSLPLAPDFLAGAMPTTVAVSADAMTAVSGFRDD